MVFSVVCFLMEVMARLEPEAFCVNTGAGRQKEKQVTGTPREDEKNHSEGPER